MAGLFHKEERKRKDFEYRQGGARMLYDLKGGANMAPMVGILYSAVKENFQRLQSITNGMLQEEVDYKGPDNNFNSTAQLIRHLMYVDLNWVYRIKGLHFHSRFKSSTAP